MLGRQAAVGFELHVLNFSFFVFEETGLTLGVNWVVFMDIELIFVILEWFHVKVLHRFQSLKDPLFIIGWELGITFEQIVFA